MYCTSIDDMNALVDPLPLVPAMCMVFRRLKSEGYPKNPPLSISQPGIRWEAEGFSHLISNPTAPFDHLRDRGLVHALARLPDGVHDREVGLKGIQSRDSILDICSVCDPMDYYCSSSEMLRLGAV